MISFPKSRNQKVKVTQDQKTSILRKYARERGLLLKETVYYRNNKRAWNMVDSLGVEKVSRDNIDDLYARLIE